MKRALAWFCMAGCYVTFCVVIVLVLMLNELSSLSAKTVSPFVSFLLRRLLGPVLYGIELSLAILCPIKTVDWCESIAKSRRGVRYIIFGGVFLILCSICIFQDFRINYHFNMVFCAVLIIKGIILLKKEPKRRLNADTNSLLAKE